MESATQILEFYFKTVWKAAGLNWDYLDNSGEIALAVEAIVNEAVKRAKEELKEELKNENAIN